MIQKLIPVVALFVLMSSPAIQTAEACWVKQNQSLDTLENGVDLIVQKKTWIDGYPESVTIDTVYRSEMIHELIDSYNSSAYVFVATAVFSSFYESSAETISDTQLNANLPVFTDSVIIQIDTLLKSSTDQLYNGYQYPVVTRYQYMLSTGAISLSGLEGKYLLVFTDDIYNGFKARSGNYPLGFYVDSNGMIIHDNYEGVSFSFNEFLELINSPEPKYYFIEKRPVEETPSQKNNNTQRSPKSIRFNSLSDGSLSFTIPFDLLTNKVETAVYSLSGALVSRKVLPVHSFSTNLALNSLSKGVYTIVISGHDSEKKPFKASIRHCINR